MRTEPFEPHCLAASSGAGRSSAPRQVSGIIDKSRATSHKKSHRPHGPPDRYKFQTFSGAESAWLPWPCPSPAGSPQGAAEGVAGTAGRLPPLSRTEGSARVLRQLNSCRICTKGKCPPDRFFSPENRVLGPVTDLSPGRPQDWTFGRFHRPPARENPWISLPRRFLATITKTGSKP